MNVMYHLKNSLWTVAMAPTTYQINSDFLWMTRFANSIHVSLSRKHPFIQKNHSFKDEIGTGVDSIFFLPFSGWSYTVFKLIYYANYQFSMLLLRLLKANIRQLGDLSGDYRRFLIDQLGIKHGNQLVLYHLLNNDEKGKIQKRNQLHNMMKLIENAEVDSENQFWKD